MTDKERKIIKLVLAGNIHIKRVETNADSTNVSIEYWALCC